MVDAPGVRHGHRPCKPNTSSDFEMRLGRKQKKRKNQKNKTPYRARGQAEHLCHQKKPAAQ
jgi:hypothetical protein